MQTHQYEKRCTHSYVETTENRKTGRRRDFRFTCSHKAECPVCGHCVSCCPGHVMQRPLTAMGFGPADTRLRKPHKDDLGKGMEVLYVKVIETRQI